ncbi:MAG: DUF3536 domain-containing protein [Synergistetes bacterium]|nr:DUF3536 domain-containing protein [Synergistota bacterium]
MNKFICVHGHFYQPPRENPYFEEIFKQKEASPFHDWNEKIYNESYLPNTASRVLDENNRILDIVNNYKYLSFNFGPTLIAWLKRKHPELIESLKEADQENIRTFGGFGNAIAQAHSHMIMPLAKELDMRIQIVWGIKSFENTFGRKPGGMWLPETAVDLKTLKILSEEGIKFTILGAHQCEKVKSPDGKWIDVDEGSLDVTRPYKVSISDNACIWIFFFHRALSGNLSFGNMLRNGDAMGERLIQEILKSSLSPAILLLACDGETFGHHHKFGEMALSRAIKRIKLDNSVSIAPLEYILTLFENQPSWEAKIKENTSWSCAHGIKRWQEDCGCSTGGEPGWHQKWRGPLREAINFLIDKFDELFEALSPKLFKDPLRALEDYIDLIENKVSYQDFLQEHIKKPETNASLCLKLLELQRMKMFSQTSCGWFFSDISGVETVQILLYASRGMLLYKEIKGIDLEPKFKEILEKAPGNRPNFPTGKAVYEKLVTPAIYNKDKLLASLAFLSKIKGKNFKIGAFKVNSEILSFPTLNENSLTSGKIEVSDLRTQESYGSFFINIKLKNLQQLTFLLDVEPEQEKSINEKLTQINMSSRSNKEIIEFIKSFKPYAMFDMKILPSNYIEEVMSKDILELKQKLLDMAEIIYREARESIMTMKEMGIEIHPLIKESLNLFFENLILNTLEKYSESLWPPGYTNILLSVIKEASTLGATPNLEKANLAIENRYRNLLNLYLKTRKRNYLEEIKDTIKVTFQLKLYPSLWTMQNETYKIYEQIKEELREILLVLGFSNKLTNKGEG